MDRMQSDSVDLLQVGRKFRFQSAVFPLMADANNIPLVHTPNLLAYHSHCTTPIQFHWNDYSDLGYMTALKLLQVLQREGLISALGLCNFDTIRMDEICTTLGPDSIVSNQIQVRCDLVRFLNCKMQQSRDTRPVAVYFLILCITRATFSLLYVALVVLGF
jgi:diketogulonate reductase-like aldo/keto reductase